MCSELEFILNLSSFEPSLNQAEYQKKKKAQRKETLMLTGQEVCKM